MTIPMAATEPKSPAKTERWWEKDFNMMNHYKEKEKY